MIGRRGFFGLLAGAPFVRAPSAAPAAAEWLHPACPLCGCLLRAMTEPPIVVDAWYEIKHGRPNCACDPIPGFSWRVQFLRTARSEP